MIAARRGMTGRDPRPHRRGSAYALVLIAAVLVTLMGVSAAAVSRVEIRREKDSRDAVAARAAARAALELGFVMIRLESDWNALVTRDAVWASSTDFNGAQYRLTRTGYDTSDPANPKLKLLALGMFGDARVQFEAVIVRGAWVEGSGWKRVVD